MTGRLMRIYLLAISTITLTACSGLGQSTNSGNYQYDQVCGYTSSYVPNHACDGPVQSRSVYTAPTVHQTYSHGQPVYTSGGYGTQVNHPYHVQPGHPPLRGMYGHPKRAKSGSGLYVSGYGGFSLQTNSTNKGNTEEFITGNIGDGTRVIIADNTPFGWDTDFDTGAVFGGEVGYRTRRGWRLGLEATRSKSDIHAHENLRVNGADPSILDASTFTGSMTPTGVTVEDFFANGQGSIEQQGIFANAYYDFNRGRRLRPYLGAGVGLLEVDVDYSPSGTATIDSSNTLVGYQGRAGVSYNVQGPFDVFSEYTYRAAIGGDPDNLLFPGKVDVENKQSNFTVGARFNF